MKPYNGLLFLLLAVFLCIGTFPSAVLGQSHTKGTTVIGKISKADLEKKCPGGTVTLLGTNKTTGEYVYEVKGGPTDITQRLAGNAMVSRVSSHGDFTAVQLQAMQKVSDALLHYAGTTGWRVVNGKWQKGGGPHDGGPGS